MCGIVGFTGQKNPAKLDRALKSIIHRGRDESVSFSHHQINLGMNRLAIVDLQPQLFPMKYRRYVMVYNGEIYNYPTLKNSLQKKGVKFSTQNDGEVILPLFALYQEKAFAMLDGMFAIAIFDTKKQEVILARDKFGEKPLYYTQNQTGLYFASEIKALLQVSPTSNLLNHFVLGEYLSQGFVFAPNTLLKNVFCLVAGQSVRYSLKNHQLSHQIYYHPQAGLNLSKKPVSDLIGELELLLKNTIKSRLMADVPVGTFLSGGIDSSLITYFAAQHVPQVNTYSISFPGHPKNNESVFARQASQHLSTHHHEIECSPSAIKPAVENIGHLIDHPISDPACLPTFLLAQEARKKVKVVLTGEGADEIFGGYHHYWKELLAIRWKNSLGGKIALPATKLLSKKFGRLEKLTTPLFFHYNTQKIFDAREINLLLGHSSSLIMPAVLSKYSITNPILGMQLTDIKGYLPEQLFMKVDKMTMANNLESRAPYVAPAIVQFGLSLPTNLKSGLFQGKWLLKKIAEKHLPKMLVWRPKHGFTLPLADWLNQELNFVNANLKSLSQQYQPILNSHYIDTILEEHRSKLNSHTDKIWTLYVLLKWMYEYQIKA